MAFYDDEDCIDCGISSATNEEEMLETSKKICMKKGDEKAVQNLETTVVAMLRTKRMRQ
jgi:hypothetical protein